MVFPTNVCCDCFRMLAHRAFCAGAIFRREAADITRVGRFDSWAPVPIASREQLAEFLCLVDLRFLFCKTRPVVFSHEAANPLAPCSWKSQM